MDFDIEKLLSVFKVKSEAELISAKTTTKQSDRVFTTGYVPKLVKMTAEECKTLCDSAGIEYLEGYEERVLQYCISNEERDRHGDIVRGSGMKFENYIKNPVIAYGHDHFSPPIGATLKVWYDVTTKCVYAWGLFVDDRIDGKGFADTVFKLARAGFMKACSIGFNPMKVN